jgi:hypothetical protein
VGACVRSTAEEARCAIGSAPEKDAARPGVVPARGGEVRRRVAPKALEAMKDRVRAITTRIGGRSMLEQWKRVIREHVFKRPGRLSEILPPNATFALLHQLGTWTNTAELTAVASKRKVSRVRNEIPTDAYCVVNLRSSFRWRFLRVDAGVENLLDRMYFNPLGGAYVGQGPTMSTTGVPWGVAVPGPARSFNVAVNLEFHL